MKSLLRAAVAAAITSLAIAEPLPVQPRAGCNADNCARAVSATRFGDATLSSRLGDCSSFFEATYTPPTSTVIVTETVGVTVTTNPLAKRCVGPRTTTPVASGSEKTVPAYASPCSGSSRYSSACSCWGAQTSTTTAPTPTVTSTLTINATITSTEWNSPNITPGPVKLPPFNDWTLTYTYDEITLPVFDETPVTVTPSFSEPSTVCMLGATPTGTPFYVIDQTLGYMFDNAGQPGPPQAPTSEADYQAMMANFDPPTFEFQVAEAAPAGVFDLVHTNSSGSFYVALQPDTGNMTFLTSSTNGAEVQGRSTTVFGVSCKGFLTVVYGSTSYIWTATNSSTVATPGTPDNDGMYLLDANLRTPLNTSPTSGTTRRRGPNYAEYGEAPRCPNYPTNVLSIVRSNARGLNPNGCGPANGVESKLIPNLNFGSCCNAHDDCFDSCPTTYFESCNQDFLGCMIGKCGELARSWWQFWLYPACMAAADLYGWVVTTDAGVKAFNQATSERCGCVCQDPNYDLCDGEHTCRLVRGPQDNDPNNCGACGATCPYKTHCSGGSCACDGARCGNLCVDFLNHPRNCGGCGIVCPSGYCYKGVCFTPPPNPTMCYPVDAVQNGGFADGSSWTISGYPEMQSVSSPDPLSKGNANSMLLQVPHSDSTSILATQDIHVCAGVQYEIDFLARTAWGTDNCILFVWIGPMELPVWNPVVTIPITQTGPGAWGTWGPYPVGPFNLSSRGAQQAADFYITLPVTIQFTCIFLNPEPSPPQPNNPNGIRIDDFSIHQA